jgi:hypothetical protein
MSFKHHCQSFSPQLLTIYRKLFYDISYYTNGAYREDVNIRKIKYDWFTISTDVALDINIIICILDITLINLLSYRVNFFFHMETNIRLKTLSDDPSELKLLLQQTHDEVS